MRLVAEGFRGHCGLPNGARGGTLDVLAAAASVADESGELKFRGVTQRGALACPAKQVYLRCSARYR
jgi:hypothetical protein